jgi:hypothetical protein
MNVFSQELSYCRPGTAAVLDRYATLCDDRAAEALDPYFAPHEELAPAILCLRAMVGYMGVTLHAQATAAYQRLFMAQAWTVVGLLRGTQGGAPYLDPPYLDLLRGSFDVVRYQPPAGKTDYAYIYFGLARSIGADVRAGVADRIGQDWGFGQDQLFSETWQHARYLLVYNDKPTAERTVEKIRHQPVPNVALSYLRDIAGVRSDSARWIVTQFKDDPRMTDNGIARVPPKPLGREVQAILANW